MCYRKWWKRNLDGKGHMKMNGRWKNGLENLRLDS